MSLLDSLSAERIDFRIADMAHHADAGGVHFKFGEATLQDLADAFYAVREFERGCGFQPNDDPADTPRGPNCGNGSVALCQLESVCIVAIAGHRMEYLLKDFEGVRGGWLHAWNGQPACVPDHPQAFADLADTVLEWLEDHHGVTPQLVEPEA